MIGFVGGGALVARPATNRQVNRCDVRVRRARVARWSMRQEENRVGFPDSISFEQSVPGDVARLDRFLRENPAEVIIACWSRKLVTPMKDNVYRTSLPPLKLFNFDLTAFVDVKSEYDTANKCIRLKSVRTKVDIPKMGLDPKTFRLELDGVLSAVEKRGKTYFEGEARLEVSLVPPMIVSLMPKPIAIAGGKQLTSTILNIMKSNLRRELGVAYQQWVKSGKDSERKMPVRGAAN